MDSKLFGVYVKECLAPALNKGDTLILDNLPVHTVKDITKPLIDKGINVVFLPKYSPDFNPVELAWSKMKSYLRKTKAGNSKTLFESMAQALEASGDGGSKTTRCFCLLLPVSRLLIPETNDAVESASMTNPDALPPAFGGRRYNAYNDWVKRVHGGRLQKISVDAGFTCPNRDGTLGVGGCTFCNNEGFTPSYLREQRDITAQIDIGVAFMRRRYPDAKAFLAYFQSYSNTYGELARLQKCYETALAHPDIAGLAIGTRPDCLPDEVLDYLAGLARHVPLELEIGIESCNDAVLKECLRGHDFACAQDAIARAAARGLSLTGHLLLGLPLETRESLVAGAAALARLPLDALKFHQLQIVRGTRLASRYRADPASVPLMNPETYLDAVIDVLERLPPRIRIQRLGSEVPPAQRVSPDWGIRLSRFPARLDARLEERKTWQGRLYPCTQNIA